MEPLTQIILQLPREELKQVIKGLPDLVQQIIYGAIKEKNKKYPQEN